MKINMFKKIIYIYVIFITNIYITNADVPTWLIPNNTGLPWNNTVARDIVGKVWWNFISEMIQYVAVIAVISLMFSGIMYLTSGWVEEKVKKAKTWVIYSLVWVLLSISAWTIIKILNELTII